MARVKLTTSRYYTPDGRSIQQLGIEPDILTRAEIVNRPEDEDGDFVPLTESSLRGALINDTLEEEDKAAAERAAAEADAAEEEEELDPAALVYDDYQLYEALNLLRGLSILSQKTS